MISTEDIQLENAEDLEDARDAANSTPRVDA